MLSRSPIVIAVLVAASFVFAACGDDYDTQSTGSESEAGETKTPSPYGGDTGGSTVEIAADREGGLAYRETEVTAKPGSDTIEFDNASATPHNVEIEDAAGDEVAVTETISGTTTSTTADLKPGTYTFYCSVAGHREAGMEGTLTVE